MTDQAHGRVLDECSSLIKIYQQVLDDAPGSDLILTLLPKSGFFGSWFGRLFVRYNPYTAAPLVRHFLQVHINKQLGVIQKLFQRLDRLDIANHRPRTLKDACSMIEEWRKTLQKPLTLRRVLQISIPGAVMSVATYLWHRFGPSQSALNTYLIRLRDILADRFVVFAALALIFMLLTVVVASMLGPPMVSFSRKRTLFVLKHIYTKEDKLFEAIRTEDPKARKIREFPLDLALSFFRILPVATWLGCCLLAGRQYTLFNNELAATYRLHPEFLQHSPPGFTPPQPMRVFDGPFWLWIVVFLVFVDMVWLLLVWRWRVLAKQV